MYLPPELGLVAGGHMSAGQLVPDSLMVGLMAGELGEVEASLGAGEGGVRRGWLLDGFPRTLSQAQALSKIHQVSFSNFLKKKLASLEFLS